jgi:hypothetical protein
MFENVGCTDPSVAYDDEGGTDIGTAEALIAHKCGISLPRVEGDNWFGIVGACGGHTKDYHYHRSLGCLYQDAGAHSTAVGDIAGWKMYGKWENYANKKMPYLDACGGHFGVTPLSGGAVVYHYHTQGTPPYTVGCHGPTADNKLVSVAACRALYTQCSGSAFTKTTATGSVSYVRDCPCFDADGSNSGTPKELPALSTSDISYTSSANSNNFGTKYSICTSATSCSSVVANPSPSPGTTGTASPVTVTVTASPATASPVRCIQYRLITN